MSSKHSVGGIDSEAFEHTEPPEIDDMVTLRVPRGVLEVAMARTERACEGNQTPMWAVVLKSLLGSVEM